MKQPVVEQEHTLDVAPVISNGSSRRRQEVSEQLGDILNVMVAYRNGDFTVRLPSTPPVVMFSEA